MKIRTRVALAFAGGAAALSLGGLTLAPTASASTPAYPVGHVVLKGGRLALRTTGKAGSGITVGPYRPASEEEQFLTDHEMGATYPGGRLSLFWAPGKQTNFYIDATTHRTTLVNGAYPDATIFTAWPTSRGYIALTLLRGGAAVTKEVLTYVGHGKVVLARIGAYGPTADQLWKVG